MAVLNNLKWRGIIQQLWIFQPGHRERYEGDGTDLGGVGAWLFGAFG